MRPKKKYVIHPGWIKSKSDGDIHYVDAPLLMRLYHVDPAECVVHDPNRGEVEGMIHLHPKRNGNYNIPEVTK